MPLVEISVAYVVLIGFSFINNAASSLSSSTEATLVGLDVSYS